MPASYAVDLRTRVLAACDMCEGTRKQIAERFRISESTLYLCLQQRKDEGRINPVGVRGWAYLQHPDGVPGATGRGTTPTVH